MSKIGIKPVLLGKASVEVSGNVLKISGAKGSFDHVLPAGLFVRNEQDKLFVGIDKDAPEKSLFDLNVQWGSNRSLIQNKIVGVTEGFQTVLIISGLGFKVVVSGKNMNFTLGYSHKLDLQIPDGIAVEVDKTGQRVVLKGIDKNKLGDFASKIKALRRVEPYKGTGIFIEGEKILRKAGKSTK